MDTCNYVVHRINQKHMFFEKESPDAEKIDKTLFTMFLLERVITQRYNKKGFTVHVTLIQSNRGNQESIVWNSQRYRQDIAPLSEVRVN